MRIGIGVTSFNRPECLKECLEHITRYTFMDDVKVYIAKDTDEDRRGVAYRKNECLKNLKDCDHVFLFDDDTFPIKDGWIEFFINSKQNHLLYLDKKFHKQDFSSPAIKVFNDCGGVFMYLSRKAIDRAGYFDEDYGIYGFEHADYSNRVYGMKNYYLMKTGTEKYIYSHDYSTPNFKSSISEEEKNECVKKNWNKYFEV